MRIGRRRVKERTDLAELEAALIEANDRIVLHVKNEHPTGLPPSCHDCNGLAQDKMTIEAHIRHLKK